MSTESRDIQRLIADAIEDSREGALDEQRLDEVRELLETSPEARKAYLQHNQLNSMLGATELKPTASEVAVAAVDIERTSQASSRPSSRRGVRPALAYAGWAAAAAVALAFVINAVWFGKENGEVAENRSDIAPEPAAAIKTSGFFHGAPASVL